MLPERNLTAYPTHPKQNKCDDHTVTFGILDHSAPQPDLLLDIDSICTGRKLPE